MLLLAALPHLESSLASVDLVLAPPRLVGASNHSATHYWFPTDMAVVFNESHFLLGARLADDCSDYFCNHTSTCKPSDPSHQISMSVDGGQTFSPLWTVGGASPWSPGLHSRPFLGPCSISLNDTSKLTLYQGKIWSPWKSRAAIFNLDPVSGLAWGLADRPISYVGVDSVCGTGHMWNQGVIKFAGKWLMSAQCDIKVGLNKTKEAIAPVPATVTFD